MKVFLSELAESKLLKLLDYLTEKWDLNTRNKFLRKFNSKINQISSQPDSCPISEEIKGVHKCVVTKQTTFYYRVIYQLNEIEIITIFDTRQSFEKLNNSD